MYTIQTLWTIAREKLDVTVIVFANRSYRILNVELGRVGAGPGGAIAQSMLDLRNPDLDFVRLAEGMGVEASRVDNIESFYDQFGGAMAKPGPRLIEAII
jgi:acetolactate synthase-1/2/3 large subunit